MSTTRLASASGFSSRIVPRYARRLPKVDHVLPVLYLRGLSTGDFRRALEQLLGEDAAGLSPSTIIRLCKDCETEHERFRQRSLRFQRYACLFVGGVDVSVRLGEDDRLCLLVVIGVREDGVKELLAVEDGYRESTESWAAVLRDLKARGLNEPKLVIGDGALGTWAALRDVFPGARQRPGRAAQAPAAAGEDAAARDDRGRRRGPTPARRSSDSAKRSTPSTPRRSPSSTATAST